MKVSAGGIFLKKNIWWYSLYKDGVRERRSLKTTLKPEALKRLQAIRTDLALGVEHKLYKTFPFEDLRSKYIELILPQKAQATQDRFAGGTARLLKHFGRMPMSGINQEEIQRFIVSCQVPDPKGLKPKGLQPNSINKYVATLSLILAAGVEWGYLKENPVKKCRPLRVQPKEIPWLTDDQIKAILGQCNPMYRLLVITLLETGARIGEAMRIRWRDIDFERGIITLQGQKTYELRPVPLSDSLRAELEKLERTGELVFPTALVTVKNQVPDICKRAKIYGVSCHTLRHTAISRMVAAGVDLRTVMQWSGHKRLATMQRYAHLAPGYMEGVRGKLQYRYE